MRPEGKLIVTAESCFVRIGTINNMRLISLLTHVLLTAHSFAAQPAYRSVVLADNPIGYWEFDEASGATAADSGGGTSEPGAYQNCALGQASAFAALGTCAQFNGTTSRVRVEPSSVFELGTGDFSVELWYKTAVSTRGDMFNYKNANDFGLFANQAASGQIGGWHNGQINGTTTTINAWHHLVATRSAGTLLLYLDGVQVASTADAQSFSANAPLFIGANHSGATAYAIAIPFNGWIDEVAVYGTALSAARVLAHYQAADTPATPVIVNTTASGVAASTVTVGGQLTTVGNPAPTVSLFWGDNDAGTSGPWDNELVIGTVTNTTAHTRSLTGLTPGTPYYFRNRAVNSSGTVWAAATASFTTGVATAPAVANLTPTGVTGISATLRGQVTNAGNDVPVVKVYFGPSDGGTSAASWQTAYALPAQSGAFSQLASPLTPLTTYYYRCFAQNAAGSAWAPATQTFTTPAYTPPPIIINEIHYNEDDPTVHSEFIELHNPGAATVDIAGWFFDQGINFTLPAGSSIPAGGYLVVCEDPATLQAKWSASGTGVVSWQNGVTPRWNSLSNNGETIRLKDAVGNTIDEVDYQLGFPWPTVGDPPNYSIELLDPSMDNSVGGNWRRSDGGSVGSPEVTYVAAASKNWKYFKALSEPSAPTDAWRTIGFNDSTWLTSPATGAPFGYGDPAATLLSDMRNASSPPGYTGIYLRHTFNLSGPVSGNLVLRVWCDDGCIVWINGQEVQRLGPAAGAFVPFNGVAGRNHEGYNATSEDRTIAAPNSILQQGTNVLCIHALNDSLNGSSDFWIDADLKRPSGTSGGGPTPRAINSVLSANAPPAIRQVNHDPVMPTVGQTWIRPAQDVRVSALITDPDSVPAASLRYQIVEPGDYIKIDDARYEAPASWTTVAMNDGGAAGDLIAGDGIFSVIIPASVQIHRRLIRYRLTATDGTALSVRAPYADDPQPNFAYFVYGDVPAWSGAVKPGTTAPVTYSSQMLSSVQPFHLITTPAEHAGAQAVPVVKGDGSTQAAGAEYGHSLYNWKGCLCYDGKVYDHIRFRTRGGVWRFEMGKNMWKFDFNKGHDLVVRDNYGKKFGQGWKKLNFSSCIQQGDFWHRGEQGLFESVGFRLFQLAGCPGEHTSFSHFRIIERPSETNNTASQYDDDFQGLYLAIEQQDGQFLDEHGLPDGNLYKMEGGTGELNNQGASQPKDKSDLTAFQAYTQTEAWWRANCDLDNYYDLRAIIDAIHHYDIGDGKNYFYYHNSETNKWTQLPWDLDLTWSDNMYRADSELAGISPSGNSTEPFLSRIWNIPPLRQELQNRVREIHDLLFNAEQTGMLIDEMASHIYQPGQPSFVNADHAMWDWNPILTSTNVNSSKAAYGRFYQASLDSPDGTNYNPQTAVGTFAGMIAKLKSYISLRRAKVIQRMLLNEAQIPATPAITGPGASVPTNAMTFTSGAYSSPSASGFSAMKWRIAKITNPTAPGYLPYAKARRDYEIESSWESPEITSFTNSITIPPVAAEVGSFYRVRVRHKDAAGRWSHWSAPAQFTATAPDVSLYFNSLVVSEVMYHPRDPQGAELAASTDQDDFEFITVMNVGATTLDMSPIRFTKGIDFNFAGSAVTSLAPGQRAVIVKNTAAFNARYGGKLAGITIAGNFKGNDNLNNGGEQIKLSFGTGTTVRDFTYDDTAPWPAEADGGGYSLVLIAPWTLPDHTLPQNWRLSTAVDGCPGLYDSQRFSAWKAANGQSGDLSDTDNDGLSALLEYALLGNPATAGQSQLPSASFITIGADQFLTLTVRVNRGADDVLLFPERTTALDIWDSSPAAMVLHSAAPDATGGITYQWRSAIPWNAAQREQLRLRVQLR